MIVDAHLDLSYNALRGRDVRRPAAEQTRTWPESAAGVEEAPGRDMPIASAIAVMVLAVPMVMQVP